VSEQNPEPNSPRRLMWAKVSEAAARFAIAADSGISIWSEAGALAAS